MAKIIVTIALLICAIFSEAQTVNKVPIKDIDGEYVEIFVNEMFFSTKLALYIDFGQYSKSIGVESFVRDATGEILEFNSIIDALNFMSKNGFEVVTVYMVTEYTVNKCHYLLRNTKNKAKK